MPKNGIKPNVSQAMELRTSTEWWTSIELNISTEFNAYAHESESRNEQFFNGFQQQHRLFAILFILADYRLCYKQNEIKMIFSVAFIFRKNKIKNQTKTCRKYNKNKICQKITTYLPIFNHFTIIIAFGRL